MKRIAWLLCLVVLLSGCSSNSGNKGHHGIAFPKKGVYFCPVPDYDGSYILSEDVFDASEKCDDYKSEFWQDSSPGAYEDCLKKKGLFVERFQLGTCAPVLKKTHNVRKSGCLFELATKYNKIVKYNCFGPDIPSVVRIIKTKYEVRPHVNFIFGRQKYTRG